MRCSAKNFTWVLFPWDLCLTHDEPEDQEKGRLCPRSDSKKAVQYFEGHHSLLQGALSHFLILFPSGWWQAAPCIQSTGQVPRWRYTFLSHQVHFTLRRAQLRNFWPRSHWEREQLRLCAQRQLTEPVFGPVATRRHHRPSPSPGSQKALSSVGECKEMVQTPWGRKVDFREKRHSPHTPKLRVWPSSKGVEWVSLLN